VHTVSTLVNGNVAPLTEQHGFVSPLAM